MVFIVSKNFLWTLSTIISLMLCVKSTTESTAAVSPVSDCQLYHDMYICTGAQYRMYCNTTAHTFNYRKSQYQDQYQCINNNCNCTGNKDTCTCSSSTLSSCFCESYGNSIALTTAVSPVYDCGCYNDTYICTGDQYHMYCDTTVSNFDYWRDSYQNQYQYRCSQHQKNCSCIGNKDNCTCYGTTLSSCFCESYSNSIDNTTAVSPHGVYECARYNDTYICTGAQYRMYCNTSLHDFYYSRYNHECWNNNCYCTGNKNTCSCSGSILSSCFCETYGNSIALTTAISPVYGCGLYNDTYICTGAQYRMYCDKSLYDFRFSRNKHQNQYQCVNKDCNCIANKDTCTCSSSTFSSCFCTSYDNNITLTTAVSPVTLSDCGLNNDTYICTGAQYRMYCNTSLHDFYYSRYEHQCWNNNCDCRGNKNTCTCYYSTSSCFCQDSISTKSLSPTITGLNIILLKDYMDDQLMEILNVVAVIVGLVFLTLALLTFAFCRWSPGVNNVARINICLSLLLAHLLFLLTQQFLNYIHPNQVLCAVISGFLHFLILSSFLWMLIETVLLFICVKNLSQISSKQREVLSSRFMIVIGYVIALVGVSVGLVPEGHGSEKCWIKREEIFIWSFLGPVCIILALNTIIFIIIIISLNSTLTKLKAEVSQMKQTKILVFKTVAQFVVLACPWILGFFTNRSKMVEILFLILNSQQGTFIFLIHCVLNNEIRQQYVEWLSAIVSGLKPRTIKSAPQNSLNTSVSMYQRMRSTEVPLI